MARRRAGRLAVKPKEEPLVNEFTAQHGDYRTATVVDLSQRRSILKVLRNHGASQVDRWWREFSEAEQNAIQHCQALWASCGTIGRQVAAYGEDKVDFGGTGLRQSEALADLSLYQDKLPPLYWAVFEHVVRFDLPSPVSFYANRPQQQAAVRTCVSFVANMIAQWRRY